MFCAIDLAVECDGYDECTVRDDGDYCNEAEAHVTMTSDGAFMNASNQSVIECDPIDDISNQQVSHLICHIINQILHIILLPIILCCTT